MIQLELFEPPIIQSARLVATESPRQAFYNVWLEVYRSVYRIRKESGAGGKIYDKRSWSFESLGAAEKEFERRVRQKTNPARRGRKYRLAGRDKRPNLSLSPVGVCQKRKREPKLLWDTQGIPGAKGQKALAEIG